MDRAPLSSLLVCLAVASLGIPALAQRGAPVLDRTARLEQPHRPYPGAVPRESIGRPDLLYAGLGRPAILLTGYWPPSNEMLRRFSPDPLKNPQGWVGQDWEGRGYDVYAYFPEFNPPNCSSCGVGTGDLKVDYQDTSVDFWQFANALEPIAVITFSRGSPNNSWELEMNQYNRSAWIPDYVAPTQPTPAPPDASVPAGHLRLSALPMQEVVDAIAAASLGLNPFICYSGDGGGFLSEFIAYHGVWYQALHQDPADPAWCVAAGHVHVGGAISWDTARLAAEVTLRTVMDYVDGVTACSGSVATYCTSAPNSVGPGARMGAIGQPSLSANQFGLSTSGAPPGQLGIYFYGTPQPGTPFGNGERCAGAPTFRLLPSLAVSGGGYAMRMLDLTQPPLDAGSGAATLGATHGFQFWYRDAPAGGANFNLSDALQVTWCP